MRHWDAGQWENGGEIEAQQWQFEWEMMIIFLSIYQLFFYM